MGDPLFPRPPREGSGWQGAVLPRFLRGVVGNPGFPICSPQAPCAGRTTPACNRGRANPLPDPPPLGEGTGLLPSGRGLGNPGFPVSQPVLGAAGAPSGRGLGKPGFPMSQPLVGAAGPPPAGAGETRFPRMFPSDGHAHGAQRQNENSIVLGRAQPSHTLPRAGQVHLRVSHAARIRLFVSPSLAHFPSASQEAYPRAGETR